MSVAPRSRPVPAGRLVTIDLSARPRPAIGRRPPAAKSWSATVLGAAALCPLLITTAGLLLLALRPVPQAVTETAYAPPPPAVDEDDLSWFAEDPVGPEPDPVEPGEARPRSKDLHAPQANSVPGPAAPEADPATPTPCQRLGTAIDFVRSPMVAFARAAREQKLVMVLHLAGNFEDPGFT